jgi:hypothetical protein
MKCAIALSSNVITPLPLSGNPFSSVIKLAWSCEFQEFPESRAFQNKVLSSTKSYLSIESAKLIDRVEADLLTIGKGICIEGPVDFNLFHSIP